MAGDGAVVEVVGIAVKERVGQGEERIVLEDVPDLGELGDLRHGEQPEVLRAGDENVAVDRASSADAKASGLDRRRDARAVAAASRTADGSSAPRSMTYPSSASRSRRA